MASTPHGTDRTTSLTRRSALSGAAALAATGALLNGPRAGAGEARTRSTPVDPSAIRDLESRHDRRIGVYASNLRTGRTLAHRADERFVMCSTFKVLAAAAVLDGRLVTPDRRVLGRPVHYPPSLVTDVGYAAVMQEWERTGHVPTVEEVCEAAVSASDNAAANWLLGLIGGPGAITRLARDLGDRTTALTRWEPALNQWTPGATRDTTTPRAMGANYAELLLGRALARPDRERLTDWMLASRTGDRALRKGLPQGWRIAEKTGSGDYGARNDVGVAWTPEGAPVLISCFTNGHGPGEVSLDDALADVASVCAAVLV